MKKNTGLILATAGIGINVVDYMTAQGPPGTVSPGGIFYGPGGFLSAFPRAGLLLIAAGAGVYFLSKR